MPVIFVVEDQRILRVTLADDLRDAGYSVFEFADATSALSQIKEHDVDIVISDIRMPGLDGLEFLKKVKEINSEVYVIVMTAYATVDTAVDAIRLGAYDFLIKPFSNDHVLLTIGKIIELKAIKNDNNYLRSKLIKNYDISAFVGSQEEKKILSETLNIISNSNASILIQGETGTGKELLTNIIHFNSSRGRQPLIKVSCAILSREIFESELFGHEKGAFTGAEKMKKGRFELADKGTIYLDDVDDIPIDLQVKLLRALENQEIERVGGTELIKIDTRIIASTKQDLKKLVNEGKFREDLYYRLNVFPIILKPLREKREDIKPLLNHYVQEFGNGLSIKVDEEVYQILSKYNWPGNIRELKNLTERLVLLAKDNVIKTSSIPFDVKHEENQINKWEIGEIPLEEFLSQIELKFILKALDKCENNKTKAAKILGLPLSTLRTKMEKYKIPF